MQFLAHVERCKVLLHLVDGTSSTITKDYRTIVTELEAYSDVLGDKRRILALNKVDAMDAKQISDRRRALEKASGGEVHVISGVSGKGLPEVLRALYACIRAEDPQVEEVRPLAALTEARHAAPDIRAAKRLVVKIGSALLVDRKSGLKQGWLSALAMDVAEAKVRGADVVLVSSGSIALGRKVLGLPDGVLTLEQSQAAAAVGQIRLARAYEEVLAPHGITTAQVLVTLEDTEDRRRYLNSRATMETLLGLGVVPIVNENDTVATDEIRFGDNDRLAAQIAVTVGADQLVLLSDVDGFYTANPRKTPRPPASTWSTPSPRDRGDGGRPDQRPVEGRHEDQADGGEDRRCGRLRHGDHGRQRPAPAEGAGRRRAPHLVRPRGRPPGGPQTLDQRDEAKGQDPGRRRRRGGARPGQKPAACRRGRGRRQLRPGRAGGDPVAHGAVLGKGLVRYTSAEARLIAGHRSGEIEAILGYQGRAALVHRDDMVV